MLLRSYSLQAEVEENMGDDEEEEEESEGTGEINQNHFTRSHKKCLHEILQLDCYVPR